MNCAVHDLEVVGLNLGWVKLEVHCSSSVYVILEPKSELLVEKPYESPCMFTSKIM